MNRIASLTALSFAAAFALSHAPDALAGTATGYFRMGDNRQEYSHAIALSRDTTGNAADRKVHVYLTTHPVDPARAATSFDLDSGVTDQLREVQGGMTRITVNGDGGEGGVWWWVSEPMDTFNTSGFGDFTLTTRTATRIEGSFSTAEPREFFDKTYQFDLGFKTDITSADFSGTALPAGGGEAGKGWLAYVDAVREGDAEFLRGYLGDMAEWMMPKDDAASTTSYIETLRYGVVKTAKVTGGWQIAPDRAVLKVEGTDGDGNGQHGLVQVVKNGEYWQQDGQDLTTVWK